MWEDARGIALPTVRVRQIQAAADGDFPFKTTWLLSSRLQGGALRKRDQLIHGPLVIGMGPVFRRFDLPGRRDQKVAREAHWASRKPQAKMAMRHPAHGGAQGLAAQEPKRRFHAKFFVEGLLRIANQ